MGSLRPREEACLLARPILQEYDLSTVDVLAVNHAEFGNLAARHNLVEVAEACRKESARSGTQPIALSAIHYILILSE